MPRRPASSTSRLPWDEPGWIDSATAWIDERVERTGDVELVKARPWSAIVRVPTLDGVAWFKEDPPADAFEPALTDMLVERRSETLPELLAWEDRRMLMREVGPRLRELAPGQDVPSWEENLPLYAELQIDFMEVRRGCACDRHVGRPARAAPRSL